VVTRELASKVFVEGISMKAEKRKNNFERILSKIFRQRARRHDPMLVLNLSPFNFTDGWCRTFVKSEYARAWA